MVVIGITQIGTVAFLSAIAAFWDGPLSFNLSAPTLFAIVYTGVMATALALLIQIIAQKHTTPTRTALIFALEPVFASLFALLILRERPESRDLLGCILILAGVVGSNESRMPQDTSKA